MRWTGIGAGISGGAAAVSIMLACTALWLLLTDPVTVAGALERGDLVPIARELATGMADMLRTLVACL